MKIIKVSGCHDCDGYAKQQIARISGDTYWICSNTKAKTTKWSKLPFYIDEYIKAKTLPDNCPLEEDNTVGLTLGWLREHTIY